MTIRFAEFFAGIGLVRVGLGPAFQCVYANDNAPDKKKMYHANFPCEDFDSRDIRDVVGTDVPPCHLWTSSFPCNDTSLAGGYAGIKGSRSSLIMEFFRLLEETREPPAEILLENVYGLLLKDDGQGLRIIGKRLESLGYSFDAFILDAKWWVPQSRRRLFIHATRAEPRKVLSIPAISNIRPSRLIKFIASNDDLSWRIQSLPEPSNHRPDLIDIVENLPEDDERWWSRDRCDYLYSQFSERHRLQADSIIKRAGQSYGTIFRRVRNGKSMAELRTDGIAGCLRTPRGGSGRQILFAGGGGQFSVRLLTPRECARLQGVSDSYVIDVRDNIAYFGFGDAVACPCIQWIVDNVLALKFAAPITEPVHV